MNYKHYVLIFNILFLLLLLSSSLLFHWNSNLFGNTNRPLEILSSIRKDNTNQKGKDSILIKTAGSSIKNIQRDFATYNGIITCNGTTLALSKFHERLDELSKKRRKKYELLILVIQ